MPESKTSQIYQTKPVEILDNFFEYLPEKAKEEFKVFPHFYEMELHETKKDLAEMLDDLKDKLHPQILSTSGRDGTLNDLNWLKKKKKYLNFLI